MLAAGAEVIGFVGSALESTGFALGASGLLLKLLTVGMSPL